MVSDKWINRDEIYVFFELTEFFFLSYLLLVFVVVFILRNTLPCVVKKRLGKITRKCVGVKVKKRRRANRSEVCRYECRQYNMYTK